MAIHVFPSNSRDVIQAAINAHEEIIFNAGTYTQLDVGPEGRYNSAIRIPSNRKLVANGEVILKRGDGSPAYALFATSEFDVQGGGNENITIEGFTFDGNYEGMPVPYAEHRHCLMLAGLKHARVIRCKFRNLYGDGAIIMRCWRDERGEMVTQQPEDIGFVACEFNGQLRNRNGISIISGKDIWTDRDCVFEECSRPDMPAAVDLEPDYTPHDLIENVRIEGTFKNNKANVWLVAQWPPNRIKNVVVDIWSEPLWFYADIYTQVQSTDPAIGPGTITDFRWRMRNGTDVRTSANWPEPASATGGSSSTGTGTVAVTAAGATVSTGTGTAEPEPVVPVKAKGSRLVLIGLLGLVGIGTLFMVFR